MGQKINPHGFRVGVIKDWDSRWFTKNSEFGDTLVSDYRIREYLKKSLFLAGIPKIEIERDNVRVRVFIHCAKPGMVIGRGGSEIDKIRAAVEKIVNKPVVINVVEVRQPDLNAQLVSESVANQLERRISFRRAMKSSIGRTMKLGAKGIKVCVSGRLGGAEIARTEHYHEGTIPLQTIRADIDYGFWEANTTYGKIGVKVWIYNGEVLMDSKNKTKRAFPDSKTAEQRDARRNDRRNNNARNNNNNSGRGNFPGRSNTGGARGNFAGRGNTGGGRGNFAPRGGNGGSGGKSNKEGGSN